MSRTGKIVLLIAVLSAIGAVAYLNTQYGFFMFPRGNFDDTYVTLKFDDGLKSQKKAFELVERYGLTGTACIITSKPDSPIEWERQYYLDWQEIRDVSRFMEIASHSRTHSDLTCDGNYRDEIRASKADLERRGFVVTTFTYPAGMFDSRSIGEVQRTYLGACTQDVGVNDAPITPHLLKGFTIRRNSLATLRRAIKNNTWNILTFHDIGYDENPGLPRLYQEVARRNSIDIGFFESVLQYLKQNDIKVITIHDGCERFFYETR
jgi:peptidoglycan/xylan/chitin deacetylase (PgdA/CDA1 family)